MTSWTMAWERVLKLSRAALALVLVPSTTAGVGTGKWTHVFWPSAPSIRTKGPVCLTEVMRLGYSICIVAPCTQEV